MEYETEFRETVHPQKQQNPLMLSENPANPKETNNFPSETSMMLSKDSNYLQEFHHLDQFHLGSSFSNPAFGVPNGFYESFEPAPYGCSANCFNEVYERKPFAKYGENAQISDNFNQRNFNSIFNDVHNHNPLGFQGNGSMNFLVRDEFSSVSTGWNNKKDAMKNNTTPALLLPSSSRNWKGRRKSNSVKGQWTVEQDKLLIQLVDQYGVRKWSHIAQLQPGRIGKQCRERWHNHLRPDIKKDTWSEEEDKVLIEAHAEIGNKWAEIAKRLPGRTENSIKNHWNATKRRQYSKRKCRSKYPKGSLLQEYIKSLNLDQTVAPRQRQDKTAPSASGKATSNLHMRDQGMMFCSNDRLVPEYDFNDVPDFCFDEKLFQENCSIDSLLDEIHSAPTVDLDVGMVESPAVKKELDLVEMISQFSS